MSTKALKSQLLAAVAMVLVASVALGSSTFAWFAANRTVTATDMKVIAQTTGSLVISRGALPLESTSTITVTATDDTAAASLIPATHNTSSDTFLVYNSNPANVSAETGLVQDGKDALTFVAAENTTDAKYYVDYVVYLAANGAELSAQDITAKINTTAVADKLPGATSIDFYTGTVSSPTSPNVSTDTYGGTLNLAGLNFQTNDGATKQTEVKISNGVLVPKAGSSSAIAVLMRVYVDGALKDSGTTTFVKNVDATEIADTTLGVEFTAVNHTT
jgi:hypothetical protein